MSALPDLDQYIPASVRHVLEERYYARINQHARLEHLIGDPEFLHDPTGHVALFADHGVVHARNVACQFVQVLDAVHGTLIAARPPERLAWIRAYGVTLAYLHDVGMIDGSREGRALHPEFAAQLVFKPEFDELFDALWSADLGGLATRIVSLSQSELLTVEPAHVLRELLALSFCHSKSKVPGPLLDNLPGLRRRLQQVTGTEQLAFRRRTTGKALPTSAGTQFANGILQHDDGDVAIGFEWLDEERPRLHELALDAVDAVRALRCADALRQRGTVLKTSGSYEIFVDQMTAQALYSLRKGDDQLFLFTAAEPLSAGEANMASGELGSDGTLRVSFHRGSFASDAATRWAAYCAALVVNDVEADVHGSFRVDDNHGLKVLIESVDDNLAFADLVIEQLVVLNPTLQKRIAVVPSLALVAERERARYLKATPLNWERPRREDLLVHVAGSGHNSAGIDVDAAFDHTRLIALCAGDQLIGAGTPSGFVYIPFASGLEVLPLGGYTTFMVQAWMPIGTTGVVRGAVRNADVVARGAVELLAIPREIYLRHWHRPFDVTGLLQALGVQGGAVS